jgi:hypothetical protein
MFSDCEIFNQIYADLGGNGFIGSDCCLNAQYLTCYQQRITSIDLNDQSLNGFISENIGRLKKLKML